VFGEWIIQVIAQGQIEEATFLVEEYYQTRFEVRNFVNGGFFLFSPGCTVLPFFKLSCYLLCRICSIFKKLCFVHHQIDLFLKL
jgi:hypothetical protein